MLPRLNEILMRVVDLGTVERRNHLAAFHPFARRRYVQAFDSPADPSGDRPQASLVVVDATEQPPFDPPRAEPMGLHRSNAREHLGTLR